MEDWTHEDHEDDDGENEEVKERIEELEEQLGYYKASAGKLGCLVFVLVILLIYVW